MATKTKKVTAQVAGVAVIDLQTDTPERIAYAKTLANYGVWAQQWVTSSYAFEEAQAIFKYPAANYVEGYGGGMSVDPTNPVFKKYKYEAQRAWLKLIGLDENLAYAA